MNRLDARYVINEIQWMDYYRRKVQELKDKIDEIQYQIDNATAPKSPQGYESIGASKSMSFAGKESYLNLKIAEKDKLEKEHRKFNERYIESQINYCLIIDQTDEKDFVRDYFSNQMTKQELEAKYCISKAYKKIVQVVMNAI